MIANGEIWNHDHALRCSAQSNTPHLMLGRGAVTRPDLVAQIENPNIILPWQSLIAHQIAFLQGEAKSDLALIGRYKQWLGMLSKGYVEAKELWEDIKRVRDKQSIMDKLQAQIV